MMNVRHIIFILLLTLQLVAPYAVAQTPPPPPEATSASPSYYSNQNYPFVGKSAIQTYQTLCSIPYNQANKTGVLKPNKITGNVIRCAESIVAHGANAMINAIIIKFSELIFYSVVLAILFHALKMMLGQATHYSLSMTLIVKIIAVLYVCSPQGFYHLKLLRITLIDYPKSIVSQIIAEPPKDGGLMGYIGFGLDSTGITDLVTWNEYGKGKKGPMSDFYDEFDVLVLRTLGITEADARATESKSNIFIGAVVLMVGLFFSGSLGATIGMIVLTYLTAILFAIAEMCLYFIVVAVAINFLVAITPLAMACLLFDSTIKITKIWFSYLLVYTFQPIVLAVFLAFTMLVMQSTMKNFTEIYERLRNKWQNTNSTSNVQATIFDCLGATGTSDLAKSQITDSEMWGRLINSADEQMFYNNKYGAGALRPEDYQNSTLQNCNIKANVILLDNENVPLTSAELKSLNVLTKSHVRELIGLLIGVTFLMVMMISFIRDIPRLVNGIIGLNTSNSVTKIVRAPTAKALNFVESTGKTFRGGISKF